MARVLIASLKTRRWYIVVVKNSIWPVFVVNMPGIINHGTKDNIS